MADNMNNINTTMSSNVTSSPTTEQTSRPARRPSLLREGGLLAAHRNLDGIKSMTATGFTNSAARFEDTWGCVAFTETGFTEDLSRKPRKGSTSSEESLYLS